jgi:rubredoxin
MDHLRKHLSERTDSKQEKVAESSSVRPEMGFSLQSGFVVCPGVPLRCRDRQPRRDGSRRRSLGQHAKFIQRGIIACLSGGKQVVHLPRAGVQPGTTVLIARKSKMKKAEQNHRIEQTVPDNSISNLPRKVMNLLGSPASAFWFLAGIFIVLLNVLRRLTRQKEAELVPVGSEKYRTDSDEQLHVYRCGQCGYTLYPARGRELKFFPNTFKCPQCSAPKSEFWDLNDPDDPRNQEPEEDENENESNESTSATESPKPPSEPSEEPPTDTSSA